MSCKAAYDTRYAYSADASGAEGTLDNHFQLRKRRACATYGNRAAKWTATKSSETLYFNTMWTWHTDTGLRDGQYSKHIYLGETRVVTKQTSKLEASYGQSDEWHHRYYYHPDHLGSAQLVTDFEGNEYQRIEYTPYGELWVEKKSEHEEGLRYLPYKFTAKEMDEETGLYYYGARYLDAKYSRWLSADPAVGEYIPQAPVNDEARKYNEKLPGMGGVFNVVNFQLYHYAGNNPVKYVDPDGNAFCFVTAGIGFAYGAYKSYTETGSVDLKEAVKDALIGGAIGLGFGATAAVALTGSATASVTTVVTAAKVATATAVGVGSAEGTSIWSLDKFARGWEAEQRLGGMMNNFPVIDKFKAGLNGFAKSITSIKSMDLACKTYQKAGAIFSRLSSYINKVAEYTTQTMNGLTVSANSSTQRILELAIPSGATPEQIRAIQQASEYATQKGVELIVHVLE